MMYSNLQSNVTKILYFRYFYQYRNNFNNYMSVILPKNKDFIISMYIKSALN